MFFTRPVEGAEWSLTNTTSAGSCQEAARGCTDQPLCEMEAEKIVKKGLHFILISRVLFMREKDEAKRFYIKEYFGMNMIRESC